MVRSRKSKPTDMAKLYRHFAAVTVAVTAAIALLADEVKQSAATELQQKIDKDRAENSAEVPQVHSLIRRDPHANGGTGGNGGGFAPDNDLSNFGADAGGADSGKFVKLPPGGKDTRPVWERLGLTEEEWFALPPHVRRSLAGTNDPMIVGTEEERREAIRKMSAASRSRAHPDTAVAGNAIVLDEGSDY